MSKMLAIRELFSRKLRYTLEKMRTNIRLSLRKDLEMEVDEKRTPSMYRPPFIDNC